ncbi:unnamed protein product [Effrenium voratum]|nr:unnamed protein product [Effrenium voratum]
MAGLRNSPGRAPKQDSWKSVPLTVLPKGAVYSFPFVVGLDTYPFSYGQNVASRSEVRHQQETRAKASEAYTKPKARHTIQEAEQKLVQAGISGTTAILWNNSTYSADSGPSKVRKRRQKLTDDLLHDLIVTCGDPMEVVHHWFRIFKHYSDPPDEIALPSLPERREDIPIGVPEALSRSRVSSKKSVKRLPRAYSAPRLSQRPEIVRVPRRACKDDKETEESRNELQKTRSLLKDSGLAGFSAGQLDLADRLKVQTFTADSFAAWMESFSFVLDMQKKQTKKEGHRDIPVPVRKRPIKRPTHGESQDVTKRYLSKINQKMSGFWDVFTEEVKEASSSATSSDEDGEQEQPTVSLGEINATQVMLQSSSLAMLNSSIVRKSKEKASERAKPSYEEVAKTRAQILSTVVPAQMSLKNLSSLLALFGVHRKETVERMAKHLFVSVPRSRKRSEDPSEEDPAEESRWQDEKLPFEVFYWFMRALERGDCSASDSGHAGLQRSFLSSELLCRLAFCAITDHEGVNHSAGSAARFRDDASTKLLSYSSLGQSLRFMLHEQSEPHLETQLQGLTEFLLAALNRGEASLKTGEDSSGISFNGFQNFVRQQPQVYLCLIHLLLPLATRGPRLAAEEMHLVQKGLSHRAGELRAKALGMARQQQRRQLAQLLAIVQPWLEVG